MVDYQLLGSINTMVQEDGRDVVYQQARVTSNLVDIRMPSEERYRPKPARQRFEKPITVMNKPRSVGTVQVKKGGIRSLGMAASGGTRRSGSAVQFNKGTYVAKVIEGELEVPIDVAMVAQGGDGIDYVLEQLSTVGSQFGAHVDRVIDGAQLDAPASTVSASATTAEVVDPSGYIEGEEYDHYNSSDVYQQTFRVTNIAPPSSSLSGNFTLTFESAVSISIATTAKIFQSEGGDSTRRISSLTDVCTAATQMYSLSTTNFPSGLSVALSSWDNVQGRRMSDLIAVLSGSRPTHIATNSLGASKILNAQTALRRFSNGEMDPYGGAVPKFDELPIVVSEQLSGKKIKFINADKCFLHQFWPFECQADGVGSGGYGASLLKLSEDKLSYKGLMSGGFEFVVNHRRAFGEFTGVGDG